MNSLDKKIIIVTGASQGLGRQIAEVLGRAGATVIATDIQKEKLTQEVENMNKEGLNIEARMLNVTDEGEVARTLDGVARDHEKIDAVINNAGVDVTKPILEIDTTDWDKVINVNLRGPFLMTKYAFAHMKETGGGSIVNITSTAAKRTWANASAYHASKWGLLGLSGGTHVEGREYKIKVTAVIAGGMRTPFILQRFPDTDPKVLQDPKNVAEVIKFVLTQPEETVIPEIMVIPTNETSWP